VFAKFKCFRMLYSRKKGSDRPLLPVDGSSTRLLDHLVGIYSAEELACQLAIDVGALERYNREVGVDAGERRKTPRRHTTRVAVEGRPVEGGTRDDAEGAPLTAHELERLTSVYREDHPGAEIWATLQVATNVFTLHFCIQQPMCRILRAAHNSDGNNGGIWCTGGAIPRWPTTSATPRGAGELAEVTASLQAAWCGISQSLHIYSIPIGL
jgi:hypothetical protein